MTFEIVLTEITVDCRSKSSIWKEISITWLHKVKSKVLNQSYRKNTMFDSLSTHDHFSPERPGFASPRIQYLSVRPSPGLEFFFPVKGDFPLFIFSRHHFHATMANKRGCMLYIALNHCSSPCILVTNSNYGVNMLYLASHLWHRYGIPKAELDGRVHS